MEEKMSQFFRSQSRDGVSQKDKTVEFKDMEDIKADSKMENFFKAQEPSDTFRDTSNSKKRELKRKANKYKDYLRMGDKEREENYLKMRDENMDLKKRQCHLEDMVNQVNGQFKAMKGNSSKPTGGQVDLGLKEENERLRKQVHVMQSAAAHPVQKQKQKILVGGESKKMGVSQQNGQNGEMMRLVDRLQARLKESEGNYRQLQEKVNTQGSQSRSGVYKSQVAGRNEQIARVEERCEQLDQQLNNYKTQLENCRQSLNRSMDDLEKERAAHQTLERQVRVLELDKTEKEQVLKQLEDARRQKRQLEVHLENLVQSPFVKKHEEVLQGEVSTKELQERLRESEGEKTNAQGRLQEVLRREQEYQQEVQSLKTELKTAQQESQLHQKEVQQVQGRYQHFAGLELDSEEFNRALGTVRLEGEAPSWRTVDFVKGQSDLDYNDQKALLREIERLRLEKGDLACQLEKAQSLLKTQLDINREEALVRDGEQVRLQRQLGETVKKADELSRKIEFYGGQASNTQGKQIFDRGGIHYDDSVSVFSQSTNVDHYKGGLNSLDLYFDKLKFTQQLTDSAAMRFITVDFYSHDTQYSHMMAGETIGLQLGYEVNIDEYLLEYLSVGIVQIELFECTKTSSVSVAKGGMSLSELVARNTDQSVSAVVNETVTLYDQHENMVGLMNFKAKMRLPIQESIKWLAQKQKLGLAQSRLQQTPVVGGERDSRQLVVGIVKALGLRLGSGESSFAFFSLENKDYHSPLQSGNNPVYNYQQVIPVASLAQFSQYVKYNLLEVVVMKDSPQSSSQDLLGVAKVNLQQLSSENLIDSVQDLFLNNQKTGALQLKFHWHQPSSAPQLLDDSLLTTGWQAEILFRISQVLKQKRFTIEQAYDMFDPNNEKQIRLENFVNMMHYFGLKINESDMKFFFNRQKQPFDYQVFYDLFKVHLVSEETEPLSEEQGKVMTRIQSQLQAELSHLSDQELQRQLDINKDGSVGLFELKVFLQLQKISLNDNMLRQLIQVLGRKQQGQVTVDEFVQFVRARDFQEGLRGSQVGELPGGQDMDRMLSALKIHMQQNRLTFFTLYQTMDNDQNGFISFLEFQAFIKEVLRIPMMQDLKALFSCFDGDGNNRINVKEFIQKVKSQYQNKQETDLFAQETAQDSVVKGIQQQVSKQQIDVTTHLKQLGKGTQDILTHNDVRVLMQRMRVQLNQEQFMELINSLDSNNDDRVSVAEFSRLFKGHGMDSLERKMKALLAGHQAEFERLLEGSQERGQKGVVGINQFMGIMRQIASDHTRLTAQEMTDLTTKYKVNDRYIDYAAILRNFQANQSQVRQTSESMAKSQVMAKSVFQQLGKVIQKMNLNIQDAFNSFDRDGDGKIDQQELIQVFKMMNLKQYSEQEICMIFQTLDKDGGGSIEFVEFLNAIRQN